MEQDVIHTTTAFVLFKELTTKESFNANDLGLTEDIIKLLASLDFNDQVTLIREASQYLDVSIDIEILEKKLNKIKALKHDYELETYFFIKFAPYKLMKNLFGTHPIEFTQRRKRLGIDGKSGRPLCSGLIAPDTLIRDNSSQILRCHYEQETAV